MRLLRSFLHLLEGVEHQTIRRGGDAEAKREGGEVAMEVGRRRRLAKIEVAGNLAQLVEIVAFALVEVGGASKIRRRHSRLGRRNVFQIGHDLPGQQLVERCALGVVRTDGDARTQDQNAVAFGDPPDQGTQFSKLAVALAHGIHGTHSLSV